MSAWSIGSWDGQRAGRGERADSLPDAGFSSYLGRTIRFIPGEIIALYGACVATLRQGDAGTVTHVAFLVIFAIAAPAVTVLGSIVERRAFSAQTRTRGLLSLLAFAIWSVTVPSSGWYEIPFVVEQPGLIAIAAALAGLIFGMAAELVDRAAGERLMNVPTEGL